MGDETKCTSNFMEWGTIRNQGECPLCMENTCQQGSYTYNKFLEWEKENLGRYCPSTSPMYCSWEDGSSGCVPDFGLNLCGSYSSEKEYSENIQKGNRWNGVRKMWTPSKFRNRFAVKPCQPYGKQTELGQKCLTPESASRWAAVRHLVPDLLFETNFPSTTLRQRINTEKNYIINQHETILNNFKNDKVKNTNLSRYDLYVSYIKCLEGSGYELVQFRNKVKSNKSAESFPSGSWFSTDPAGCVARCWDQVNWLDKNLFTEMRIPHVGELSSLANIGPNKAVGYVQMFLLTPDYIEKFKGDEYMITCTSWTQKHTEKQTRNRCLMDSCTYKEGGAGGCNLYITHLPTLEKFMELNPKIYDELNVNNAFDLIHYYMSRWMKGGYTKAFVYAIFGELPVDVITYPRGTDATQRYATG